MRLQLRFQVRAQPSAIGDEDGLPAQRLQPFDQTCFKLRFGLNHEKCLRAKSNKRRSGQDP